MKSKHTFRLSPVVAAQLADYAIRKRASQAEIVETALMSFLSPDSSERMEAAFSRRLDRMLRQLERLEYGIEVGNEALALFVRFWLMANPPLPDATAAAAQAKGKERYDGFVEALARRLATTERLG
jgi:hypothetical protein